MASSKTERFSVVRFEPSHVDALTESRNGDQRNSGLSWSEGDARIMANMGYSFTGVCGSRIVGCAGVMPVWHGRAIAWGLMDLSMSRIEMLAMHRGVLNFLVEIQRDARFRRVEASVKVGWPEAERWIAMLGFVREGKMRCYDLHGKDHWLFARVREPVHE